MQPAQLERLSELDRAVQLLHERKHVWACLPLAHKIDLLATTRARLAARAAEWVELAVQLKQLDPHSPWVGEEWASGPWTMANVLNGYLDTLRTLARGELPRPQRVSARPDGQLVARVFPVTPLDRMVLPGISADVWMQPGVTADNLPEHTASLYKQQRPQGRVALVLGAGNISAIPPLDVLHRLYVLGHVAILKLNPVNEQLAPVLKAIFAPFIEAGFVQIVCGGAEVGAYLVHHEAVEEVHITGSARSHDAIVFGTGSEGEARRQRNQPLLRKPITSELGGVGPVIVVPGPWSAADIRYQAEHVVSLKLHNGGFNCVAAQLLVLPAAWKQRDQFLDAVRDLLRSLPARHAYYPGAAERQQAVVARYPSAELFAGEVPHTLLAGLDPEGDAYCFNNEFFGAVLAETSLPGSDTASYLRNAVRFANERLMGSLGATLLVHPRTIRAFRGALDQAIAELRYGTIGVNVWSAIGFSLAQATWGAYPGDSPEKIESGIGVVRNSLLFDRPEKTVGYGSFFPFPRSWLNADLSLMPKPPWFVTNRTAHLSMREAAAVSFAPGFNRIPAMLAAALRG